jgi:hypothetical protein
VNPFPSWIPRRIAHSLKSKKKEENPSKGLNLIGRFGLALS